MKETIEHIIVKPIKRTRKTPLFFQHGLFHSASCWERFMEHFARLGYECHAISLPGHGSSSMAKGSINRYSFQDYMNCMIDEIAKLSAPPVLVGHSLGGFMTMKYLESHDLPGAVLMASTPHKGASSLMLRLLRRHPGMCLRTLFGWNLRIPTPEIMMDLFFSPDADIIHEEFFRSLSHDSMKMGVEILFKIRPRLDKISTPIFVLIGERDLNFSVSEQKQLAEALQAKFMVLPKQAHNIMLEPAWQEAAEVIHLWIDEERKAP